MKGRRSEPRGGLRGGGYACPERVHELSVLRDLYEGLLPPRQREVISMKVDEDLSLAEMAERLGISRQACEDALRRGERTLLGAEDRLGFRVRFAWEEECLREVTSALAAMEEANWRETKDSVLLRLRDLLGSEDNGMNGGE